MGSSGRRPPSPHPVDGRCNAPLVGGGYCGLRPYKDRPKCRRHSLPHGGEKQTRVRSGWSSEGFLRASEKGRRDIGALLADPDLLDAKRPVAILTAESLALPVGFDEGDLVRLTLSLAEAARAVLPDGESEPAPVGVDITPENVARALVILNERTVKTATAMSRAIVAAKREERANELIIARALPILDQFAQAVSMSAATYIRDTKAREEFLLVIRNRILVTIGQLRGLADEPGPE